MKLDNAIALGKEGAWEEAQVRISPGNGTQWFVMLQDNQHKSYILADIADSPICSDDINKLAQMIKVLGLKEFTVFL